ncbi:hypothetical protein CHU00_14815 [Sphingobacterium cellulitidis]|uniref:tyrosine-type recombinase/integrase n=1 Tax=Sphingobacterium cellulitidis TaxID=1768011 RepID=UPI000B93F980|nr:site-specific integrase [Sphingobacterium cellulitidis]OYD44883.1 hypothetical protein CHU00_14815 [Sphingobacterium cellulitidis]
MSKNKSVSITQGKGNSKKELLKNPWYVEYWDSNKRIRISNGLNRIKDYDSRLKSFIDLKQFVREQIEVGGVESVKGAIKEFNLIKKDNTPKTPQEERLVINYVNGVIQTNSILVDKTPHKDFNENLIVKSYRMEFSSNRLNPNSINNIVKDFIEYHKNKGSRKKTIQSYTSKLDKLTKEFNNKLLKDITPIQIENYLNKEFNNNQWSTKTFNNARLIVYGLFEFAFKQRLIKENIVKFVSTKSVGKSTRNKVFSQEEFALIFKEVDKQPMLSMHVQMLFYTCIRPIEMMRLKVKDINWNKREIFVSGSISKNKKDGYVAIANDGFFNLLKEYYFNAPSNAFLFCNDTVLWGFESYSTNVAYKRFIKILEGLGMDNKGFTLYSVKHYSNVIKFKSGWSLGEIMKMNRHSSIEQTEIYLRDLTDHIEIGSNSIPSII